MKRFKFSVNEDVNHILDKSLLVLRVEFGNNERFISFYKPAAFIRAYAAYLEKVRYHRYMRKSETLSSMQHHVRITLSMTTSKGSQGNLFDPILFESVL